MLTGVICDQCEAFGVGMRFWLRAGLILFVSHVEELADRAFSVR
jgi:hypothetical protein